MNNSEDISENTPERAFYDRIATVVLIVFFAAQVCAFIWLATHPSDKSRDSDPEVVKASAGVVAVLEQPEVVHRVELRG